MTSAPLVTARADGITSLTLARPDRGNALGPDLVEALLEALHACEADPSCHTIVLRGQGRHFCTGLDLSDLDDCGDGELLRRLVRIEQLLDKVWRSPLCTVAFAQGRTWGAGADLFVACERRALMPGSTFRFPGARFGIALGTRRLAERLGVDRARRAVIDGLDLNAELAFSWGLATEVIASEDIESVPGAMPPVVDADTARALRAATRPDGQHLADADLAALVRSAARPGLQARIRAYRDQLRAAR
jgi:enoyl-CoA hydratase/carnithine racemase